MNLVLGEAGAVRGRARRPDRGHKSPGRRREKIGTFAGEGSVMKRFQPALERRGGEAQSSRSWGRRGARGGVAKANHKHTGNTRVATGGPFETGSQRKEPEERLGS